MHGIVHSGLRDYVVHKHGLAAWKAIVDDAGIERAFYLVVDVYDDADLHALIEAASRMTGHSIDSIHEDFGEFLTPALLRLNHALIRPHWRTMELLMNTEETIHGHVRRQVDGAKPPALEFEQTGDSSVRLYYRSPRQMPGVAKGIMRGIAAHFGERISINEQRQADGTSIMDARIY